MIQNNVPALEQELFQEKQRNLALHQILAHALILIDGELRINKDDLVGNSEFDGKIINMWEDITSNQIVIKLEVEHHE